MKGSEMTTTELETTAPEQVLEITPAAAEMAATVKETADKFVSAVKTGQESIETAAQLLIEMIDGKHHLFATDPSTGRAFTSLAAYTQHLAAEGTFPEMIATTRNVLMDKLHAAGKLEAMSKPVIAAITGTSESNAVKIRQAAKRRATPPEPETVLTEEQKQAAAQTALIESAARAVKAFGTVCDKLAELDYLLTEQEISTVFSKGAELNTHFAKFRAIKSEGELAEQARQDAITDESAESGEPEPEPIAADAVTPPKPRARRR